MSERVESVTAVEAGGKQNVSKSPEISQLPTHLPKRIIAFAPSRDSIHSIDAEIEALANLPASKNLQRDIEQSEAIKAKFHAATAAAATAAAYSPDLNSKQKIYSSIRTGKNPLPRPYRKFWTEIQSRNAARDFIYGRDEENVFSERDDRVKSRCSGVICFHTLELLDLVVNKQSFIESVPISYYCLLIIGTIRRCTKIVHAMDPRQIKMDNFVHLAVDISEYKEAPSNKLRIELWSFQDPEAHFIVGTVEIHVYNFIRVQHWIEKIHLWSDGQRVGKLAYEVAFSYGAYGYGHSNQLKNFSQPIMETISHSMFPRIKLDEKSDICDATFQARMPDELKLFTLHSFILEVDEKDPNLGAYFGRPMKHRYNRVDLEPKPMVVQQVEFEQGFPVHCRLHMNIWQKVLQPDFNDMYGEFVCLGHKRERLDYVTNLVQGRMRDIYEDYASPLFEYLRNKDLDQINRLENNVNEILFPKKIPCPSSQPYTIDMEDEKFQDSFPALRRETGYLSTLFGYDEKDNTEPSEEIPPKKPEEDKKGAGGDDIEYLKTHRLDLESKAKAKQQLSFTDWLGKVYLRMKAFFYTKFSFIFPDISPELEVPEISLTMASPEGSTTNVYSYFSREPKDFNAASTKMERLVKQTTALIDMTRKTQFNRRSKYIRGSSDSSSTASSSSDDDESALVQTVDNKQA